MVETVLPQFTGLIQQTPPAFSAFKVNGPRAYDLARNGKTVDLTPQHRPYRPDRLPRR